MVVWIKRQDRQIQDYPPSQKTADVSPQMNAKPGSAEAVLPMRRIAAIIGNTFSVGGCFGGFRSPEENEDTMAVRP